MIECTYYKSCVKGCLLGFASFYIEKWGVELNGVALMRKNDAVWVSFPSKEYTNKEGEKKYQPYIRFKEEAHRKAFNVEAKAAIDLWCAKNQDEDD